MTASTRTWTLRDGRVAELRPPSRLDAAALREVDLAVIRDGRGVVMDLEEVRSRTAYADSIRATAEQPDRRTQVVATVEGHVAGFASAHRLGPARCRHVAELALGVDPAFQRLGLARALMDACLDWCARRSDPLVERVQLCCRADNDRALALYASFGFDVEARRERFVRTEDGEWVDDLILRRFLPGDRDRTRSG